MTASHFHHPWSATRQWWAENSADNTHQPPPAPSPVSKPTVATTRTKKPEYKLPPTRDNRTASDTQRYNRPTHREPLSVPTSSRHRTRKAGTAPDRKYGPDIRFPKREAPLRRKVSTTLSSKSFSEIRTFTIYNLLFTICYSLYVLSFEFLSLQLPVYPLDGRSIKRNGSGRQIGDIVGFQC